MKHEPKVHYVGPTTHINDHHLIHAARGISNVWTAAVVAGLGVVLTATFAYSSVRIQEAKAAASISEPVKADLRALSDRISTMERKMELLEIKLRKQ